MEGIEVPDTPAMAELWDGGLRATTRHTRRIVAPGAPAAQQLGTIPRLNRNGSVVLVSTRVVAATPRPTIGIVSPGAMGSALGRAWAAKGARVVACVAGRSARTHSLAKGLDLLDSLPGVLAMSDFVVSICPPAAAEECLESILAAATATGATPAVADLNAISPMLVAVLADRCAAAGLDFVDGAISGPPPTPGGSTTLYLSGASARRWDALPAEGLRSQVVGPEPGQASGVKMCTASIYKGTTALWAQALQTASALGVTDVVLHDLAGEFPEMTAAAGRSIALAASKSDRFVAEMEQIAATQAAAGASGELFDAMAAVYRRLSTTPLGQLVPEEAGQLSDLGEVLRRLTN